MENENAETKLCKHCQTVIPKKAKVCPNCRKKQGGVGKWIVIAAVVVIIFVAAVSSGGDDDTTASKTGEVTSKGTDTESTENSGKGNDNKFSVGDIVETPDLKISFLSASKYKSDNEFIQPKDGNVFYRMEFEFENTSDRDQTISSLMSWGCYADGYAADQSYIGDDEIDATLSPGKKIKGAVYYEVPKDSKEILLEYETNFWSEDKIVFVVR